MTIDILAMTELVRAPMLQLEAPFRLHSFTGDLLAPAGTSSSAVRGIVATGNTKIDAALLSILPSLEIISLFGAGYDGVDLAEARERGIVITNTPDALTHDVADLAIAMWIGVCRRILEADRYIRSGAWSAQELLPLSASASHRVAGIIGLGRIGLAIAKRCRAMDIEVHYYSRTSRTIEDYRRWLNLEDMAKVVDVLFVSCPANQETYHLVNEAVLSQLGPQGTLVNVSRGSVVDEGAMINFLSSGRLGAAALDVFEHEPYIPHELVGLRNVILTPHIGSATVAARTAMANQMVSNLQNYFSGKPISDRLA